MGIKSHRTVHSARLAAAAAAPAANDDDDDDDDNAHSLKFLKRDHY